MANVSAQTEAGQRNNPQAVIKYSPSSHTTRQVLLRRHSCEDNSVCLTFGGLCTDYPCETSDVLSILFSDRLGEPKNTQSTTSTAVISIANRTAKKLLFIQNCRTSPRYRFVRAWLQPVYGSRSQNVKKDFKSQKPTKTRVLGKQLIKCNRQ